MTTAAERDAAIRALWRTRSRDRVLRATLWVCGGLAIASFAAGTFDLADLFAARRIANVGRFVHELVPLPARDAASDGFVAALEFYGRLLADGALVGLAVTTAIAIAAAVLAGVLGACAAPFVTRTLVTAEPFTPAPGPRGPTLDRLARGIVFVGRTVLVMLRAVPEYVWAFLLVAFLGPGAWAAVLALGLHNAGILGRLGGEVLENCDPTAPRALRALGASRAQILAASLTPAAFPRYLAFFFYRFETCVREATVLGMLGILSLGSLVQEARAGLRYDEMSLFVVLGALVVIAADLSSSWARRALREAGVIH